MRFSIKRAPVYQTEEKELKGLIIRGGGGGGRGVTKYKK